MIEFSFSKFSSSLFILSIDLYDKGHKIEIVFKYKNFILPKESGFELRVQNKKTAAKFRKAKLNHLVMEVDLFILNS